MTTFPAPVIPSFPAGYGPAPADFSSWWSQNVNFLSTRVVARMRQAVSTTTLPASGSGVLVPMDTVDEDPYGGFISASGGWQPPAGYSGWYHVSACLFTRGVPDVGDSLQLHLVGINSTPLAKNPCPIGHSAAVCGQHTLFLLGGADPIFLNGAVLNASASLLTSIAAGAQSYMNVTWLGLNQP